MDGKERCQSCGMPLGEGFFGTEFDNVLSRQYCKFCYMGGKFTKPDIIIEEMVNISVRHMQKELHFSEEKAREIAEDTIPKLRRWTDSSITNS